MIKILTIILTLNSLLSCSQTENCKTEIEKGIFISTDKKNSGYRIERNIDSQIEYFNNDTLMIKSKIEWINESEYKVIVTDRINNPKEWESLPDKYLFKIVSCNNSLHKIETMYFGEKMIFELKKVK